MLVNHKDWSRQISIRATASCKDQSESLEFWLYWPMRFYILVQYIMVCFISSASMGMKQLRDWENVYQLICFERERERERGRDQAWLNLQGPFFFFLLDESVVQYSCDKPTGSSTMPGQLFEMGVSYFSYKGLFFLFSFFRLAYSVGMSDTINLKIYPWVSYKGLFI